ncbi:MAG: DNA gyrase subunit A [Tissierellia bacterium]|nr:DNA gyrase subunit A [Tissierellia bacterium]
MPDHKLQFIDLDHEMKTSYLDYSMSVIVSRALPDVRDGLKPVHRRIIYGMQTQGLFPDRGFSKSARLTGDVMGKYHPHGDAAIYDAIVRLAQDFNMRYPLVEGQGNFGSIDGDGAAAPRYTELRMEKLTLEMLRDINKDTVDFQENYDGREMEPSVLPSRFPNLLVNGSTGIAVGMATNMAPHNLREAIDGTIAYIDHPDITVEELNEIIQGPDFPTGGKIMGYEGIKKAYRTGRGKIKLRAVADIVENKNRFSIVITEIPYQVNKANLIKKIADLVKEKRIEGISYLRDASDRKGLKIIIDIKRDANPNIVLNNLYKYTQMQTTFGIINLALVDGVPKVLPLKEMIRHYVDHQVEVVTRRTKFDLKKAEDRAHILEGLLVAIDNIDEIIHIIRTSYSDAKEKLMKRFDFSDVQAQAILDMQLKRLQGLEREKLQGEYDDLMAQIKYLRKILEDDDLLMSIIKEEMEMIKEKFGDERRSSIEPDASEIDIEALIEQEDIVVTLTKNGYIKRTPIDQYKVQNRGGKGIIGLTTREEDYVDTMMTTTTHHDIMIFTNLGRVYELKAYQIPEGSRIAKGQAVINILPLMKDEKISAMIPLEEKEEKYLIMETKYGVVKRIAIEDFANIRRTGIIAIRLDEGDELISVVQVKEEDQLLLCTKEGKGIRFRVSDIRAIGRSGRGVKAIDLAKDDEVVSIGLVGENQYLLTICENGYGKKTEIDAFNPQNRGGKGVKIYELNEKTGKLVKGMLVAEEDEFMLISRKGDMIRIAVEAISTQGRYAQGVKVKDVVSEEDQIVAATKYMEENEG